MNKTASVMTASAPSLRDSLRSSRTRVDHLPSELLVEILSYLTPYELTLASLVSSRWRAAGKRALIQAIPAPWLLYPPSVDDDRTDGEMAENLCEPPSLLVHFFDSSLWSRRLGENPLLRLLYSRKAKRKKLPLTRTRIAAMRGKYRYVGVGVQGVFGEEKMWSPKTTSTSIAWRRVFGDAALLGFCLPGVKHIRFFHQFVEEQVFTVIRRVLQRCPRGGDEPVKLMIFFVAANIAISMRDLVRSEFYPRSLFFVMLFSLMLCGPHVVCFFLALSAYFGPDTTFIAVPAEWVAYDCSKWPSRRQTLLVWAVRGRRFGVRIRHSRKDNDGSHGFDEKLPDTKKGQKYLFSIAFNHCSRECCRDVADYVGRCSQSGIQLPPTIGMKVEWLLIVNARRELFSPVENRNCLTYCTCYYDASGNGDANRGRETGEKNEQ